MLKNKHLLNAMNVVILNLAVSDLMIALCGSAIVTITNYKGSFFLGLVSLCTLTLLAYERYNVVCKPMAGFKLNIRKSCQGLAFTWLFCLFWAVSPLLGWSSYGPEGVQTSCSLGWEERSWSNYSYLLLYTLFCFLIPTAIIIYCYTNVLLSMCKLNKSVELQGGKSHVEENRRAVKMVLAMIGMFFTCWLPYTAISMVVVVDPELHIPPLVATMPMYFAKTSPVYNPIIYFMTNRQFRDCALEVLSCGRYIPHGNSNSLEMGSLRTSRSNAAAFSVLPHDHGTDRAGLEMNANFSQVDEGGAWAGKAELTFAVADCAVLLVTFVLGSAANVFVVHAVRRHKSLQTATNALLVNLALVDLLRCAADCPLLLLVVLRARGRADLGQALCSAQLACFSLNCGAQLLTVAGISVERHRAVTRPFEGGGGGGERRRRVAAWIPFTWAAAALASALCARFARDSPVYSRCRGLRARDLHTFDSFGRYVLLPAWCACLAVIAVCYGHIFMVVRAHSRKIFDKGAFLPPGTRKGEQRAEKRSGNAPVARELHKTQLVPETNGAAQTAMPDGGHSEPFNAREGNEGQTPTPRTPPKDGVTLVLELRENAPELTDVARGQEPTPEGASPTPGGTASASGTPQRARENAPGLTDGEERTAECASPPPNGTQSASERHENAPGLTDVEGDDASPTEVESASENARENGHQVAGPDAHESAHEDAQRNAPESAPQNAPESAPESAPQAADVVGEVCMMPPSFANRDRGNKKKESKLAKRSGYIIFTFLTFWLPLIGTVVLNVFLDRRESPGEDGVQELEVLAVCIACMTSLTNPIIYAAVNPQFRNEFYYLKNKCKALFAKQ
ncbi:hypothetical protein AOLI_G00058230 [Acnodon oligacanthus]